MTRCFAAAAVLLIAALFPPWVTRPGADVGDGGGAAVSYAGWSLPWQRTLPGLLDRDLARERIRGLKDQAEGVRLERTGAARLRDEAAAERQRLDAAFRQLAIDPNETTEALLARLEGAVSEADRRAWRDAPERRRFHEKAIEDLDRRESGLREKIARAQTRVEADFAEGRPQRTMPWPAFALYAGPLLAGMALWAGARRGARSAARWGVAAALAAAGSMWLGMLWFPEALGGFVGAGFLLEAVAAFMLLASSAMALTRD